jgi:hypothetical protein
MTAVRSSQRFTRRNHCPICGGYKELRQGAGIRCWGYIGDNGRVYCTRNGDAPIPEIPANRQRAADLDEPVHTIEFEIRDIEGRLQAVHLRQEFADGHKDMPWKGGLRGRSRDTLPLFGAELVPALTDGDLVIVTEGEKDCLALRAAGYNAVGTVTGAHGTPTAEVLSVLARFRVIYWPDNDDEGRKHMQRCAALQSGAIIDWKDAPSHGGAADFDGDDGELAALIESNYMDELEAEIRIKPPEIDPTARDRLIRAFSEVCTDWSKAQQMAECEQFWRIARDDHGHKFGLYPYRCHQQICTTCGPVQLAKDWQAKIARMPDRIRLLKFYARGDGSLRTLGQAFRYLRQKHAIKGGLTGRRYEAGMRAVGLLMLPADAPVPQDSQLVQVAVAATPDEALTWLQSEYVDEALYAWSSNEELATLLADTKGRRRFQAFGDAFTASCSLIGAQPVEEKRRPPSGGSGHGSQWEPGDHKCPVCGSTNYEPLPFRVPASEMEPCGNGYLWKGPPKSG